MEVPASCIFLSEVACQNEVCATEVCSGEHCCLALVAEQSAVIPTQRQPVASDRDEPELPESVSVLYVLERSLRVTHLADNRDL